VPTSSARRHNSAAISHPSLLTACQMALAVISGLSGTCAISGLVTRYINAYDHRNLRVRTWRLTIFRHVRFFFQFFPYIRAYTAVTHWYIRYQLCLCKCCRVLILFDKYRLSLPPAILMWVWEVGWVGYFNAIPESIVSDKRYLSDKIMTLYINWAL
jgi:hypothetical protein